MGGLRGGVEHVSNGKYDDQVDAFSQALNRLRAMVSPPKVFPANAAATDGRPRLDGVIGW
jgi:hypothetical protein